MEVARVPSRERLFLPHYLCVGGRVRRWVHGWRCYRTSISDGTNWVGGLVRVQIFWLHRQLRRIAKQLIQKIQSSNWRRFSNKEQALIYNWVISNGGDLGLNAHMFAGRASTHYL